MNNPNFVIIGAPKCGTSTLYNWLSQHPDVGVPEKKELFFYMDTDSPLAGEITADKGGADKIQTFYSAAALQRPVRMEATTHYLYQQSARKHLAADPSVKVCVLLRDPAKRVMSSFEYTANNLARVRPGVLYPEIEKRILAGISLYPDLVICPRSAYVLERDWTYSRYSVYLTSWLRDLGPERVKIFIAEEVFASPKEYLRELQDWLGLSVFLEGVSLVKKNETYVIRSAVLHRRARHLAAIMEHAPKLKSVMKAAYMQINRVDKKKRTVGSGYSEGLMALRDNERDAMERMLHRSIEAWT